MLFGAKRNMFVVLSPLQLICAQEAREEFCAGERNHLIIIDRKGPGTVEYDQKNEELDDGWCKISRHREPPRKGAMRVLFRIVNTAKIVMRHGLGKGKVFLGDPYLKWFRYLGSLFGTEVIWLDDGAASINVIHNFQKKGLLSKPNATTPKFFSIFSSPRLEALTNGAIRQNEFKQLRKLRSAEQKIAPGKAIFVGQWLSERGGVSRDAELYALRAAVAELREWDLTYICHRHEDPAKISEIKKMMSVVTYERSIEAVLLDSAEVPALIVSWYSTALFTLHRLFSECQFLSLQVPLEEASATQKEEWQRVYASLRDRSVEVRDYNAVPSHRDLVLSSQRKAVPRLAKQVPPPQPIAG